MGNGINLNKINQLGPEFFNRVKQYATQQLQQIGQVNNSTELRSTQQVQKTDKTATSHQLRPTGQQQYFSGLRDIRDIGVA